MASSGRSSSALAGRQVGQRHHVVEHRGRVGPAGGQRPLGRGRHRRLGLVTHGGHGRLVEDARRQQRPLHAGDRVHLALVLELGGQPVLALGVGRRVRVGPGDGGVDEGGAGAGPYVGDGRAGQVAHGEVVGAVDGVDGEAGEPGDQVGHGRRRLLGRRHRDGVAVVGHHEQHGQVLGAGGVEALPELALAGRALAQAHVGDLVAVGRQAQVGAADDVAPGLGAPDGRQALAAGGARLRDDVRAAVAPVGRHLAPARGRVVGRPDRLEQHLVGRHAQAQHQRQVAVVGKEPVVAGPQLVGERQVQRLVAGAGDLEEHAALLLQRDLAIVDAPRDVGEQQVVAQLVARVGLGARHRGRLGGLGRRRLCALHDPEPGGRPLGSLGLVRRPRRIGTHVHQPPWANCPSLTADRYIDVQDPPVIPVRKVLRYGALRRRVADRRRTVPPGGSAPRGSGPDPRNAGQGRGRLRRKSAHPARPGDPSTQHVSTRYSDLR